MSFNITQDLTSGEYRWSGKKGKREYYRMGPFVSHKEALLGALTALGELPSKEEGEDEQE